MLYGVYAFATCSYPELKKKLLECGMTIIATEKDRGSYYMHAMSAGEEIDCDTVLRECAQLPGLISIGISRVP